MTFVWGWPQIVIVCFMVLQIICMCILHGRMPSQPYDARYLFVRIPLWMIVLYYGGFWTEFRP